jgi:hypothetical protein
VLIKKKKSKLNKPGKLESRYYGPFTIKKRMDFDSFVLREGDRDVFEHHSRLKLYHENGDSSADGMELPLPGGELPASPDDDSQDSADPNMEHNGAENSLVNENSDEFVTMVRPNRRRNRPIRFDDILMGSPE